jgi:D-alanine--poly(phosphoribitol) ligase subunit 1
MSASAVSADVVDRFLAQAARQPSALAVVDEGGAFTYADLEDRARALAAVFEPRTRPRVLIALWPGVDAYAAMIATGLAGGFYTPLNLNAPAAKWRHICRLLRPDIILGLPETTALLAPEAPGALCIDPATLSTQKRFAGRGTRHDDAYVIFTSGSTGTPKGVVVPRAALAHYVDWIGPSLEIVATDRVSQYASIAFDLSVLEIYGALCFGASLHPATGLGDRLRPAQMIRREQLTVWISVPSVVGLMIQAGEMTSANLVTVRRFVFCGEPLLASHLRAIFAACPDAVVQNTYGPTEATVSMTSVRMTADDFDNECGPSVAIGAPIPDMGLHLVGGSHSDEGELVITGPQLARGYWEDPDRTRAAFRELKVGQEVARAYFTGDWAERRAGRVFFKARIDFQVKVKGFRVELDEVSAALGACGFPNSCVFKHDERLVGVVEAVADTAFDAEALRRALAGLIERYAVPDTICVISEMPRNDNGKIDRNRAMAWFSSTIEPEEPAGKGISGD